MNTLKRKEQGKGSQEEKFAGAERLVMQPANILATIVFLFCPRGGGVVLFWCEDICIGVSRKQGGFVKENDLTILNSKSCVWHLDYFLPKKGELVHNWEIQALSRFYTLKSKSQETMSN